MPYLLFAAMCGATGCPAAPPPSPVLAAQELLRAHRAIVSQFELCSAEQPTLRFDAIAWQADNLDTFLAAQRIASQSSASDLQDDQASVDVEIACEALAQRSRRGSLALKNTHARFRDAVIDTFTADDTLRIQKRDFDMTVGCIKQFYKRGLRDYDAVHDACSCQTTAMKAHATDTQIDAWLEKVGQGKGTLEETWILAAKPAFEACGRYFE